MQRPIRIGTRGSPLALYQARIVQVRLAQILGLTGHAIDVNLPVKIYTTSGDKLKGALSNFGGKGLFTKELEGALLLNEIDVAVHSMKDVPSIHQDGLMIGAALEREDPRDAFISIKYDGFEDLPLGANIGTASLRRRAQLAHIRPDLNFSMLRGSVGTRLEKLRRGDCDATLLAVAGLKRLGQSQIITNFMDTDIMLNAPAQGIIGIELRQDDEKTRTAIQSLNDRETELMMRTERAFLKELDGSCRTPIAARVKTNLDSIEFNGEVLSSDGTLRFNRSISMPARKGHYDEVVINRAISHAIAVGQSIKQEIGDRNIWDT